MEPGEIISSGLLELYVAGLASASEMEQVEQAAKLYPEVAAELNAIQLGIENYAQANAITPGSKVKNKIFATINDATQLSTATNGTTGSNTAKVVSITNYWKWVAAASVVLLIGSAVMNMKYYSQYETASKDLKETQQQLAQAEQKNTETKPWFDAFNDPNSTAVALDETGAAPGAKAKIFWIKNSGDVIIDASNLPDPPAGMQYQFWGIVDSKPVDGGLIITNDKGKKFRMQKMKSFGRAEAFAISLEKEGGNPTPTKVVSLGKII